jgi:ribonuclease R
LGEIAARISAAERRAMAAERETVDRLIASFLADKIGATFEGRISGVTKSGLFIKLSETGADGFVPASTLGDEYFRFDEGLRAMIGSRSGTAYRLGDLLEVRLIEAAPFAGALRFSIVGTVGRSQTRSGLFRAAKKGPEGTRGPSKSSARANKESRRRQKR